MEINKPVATIIIIIINLILVFLFVVPKYQELVATETTLGQKQAQYSGESAYYQKILALSQNIDKRQDALAKIDSALPSSPTFAPLVYFLQKKSNETGLIIKAITFSQPAASVSGAKPSASDASVSQVKDISFSIDVLGTYQGLKNFLVSLEKSARIFEVNNISFVSVQASQGASKQPMASLQTYDFKMEIKTHTY